jgi:GNAT superfamily N-acetyltransferase
VGEVMIRVARRGDGPALAELWLDTAAGLHQLYPSQFRIPDADGLADWMDEDLETMGETSISFVAVEDGRLVGQVQVRLIPPLESARYQVVTAVGTTRGEVTLLGVMSSHRRHGIGRALMARAEEWLRGRGATVVSLDTSIKSRESVPFYDAVGYSVTAIIFERRL